MRAIALYAAIAVLVMLGVYIKGQYLPQPDKKSHRKHGPGGARHLSRVLEHRKHMEHYERKGFDPQAERHAHELYEEGEDDGEGIGDFGGDFAETEDGEYYEDHDNDMHEYGHEDDYFGNEDFNISERIIQIFPRIDSNGDLSLTVAEMEIWHLSNGRNSSERRSEHEHENADEDGDGLVSLREYLKEDMDLLENEKSDEDGGDESEDDNGGDAYDADWVRSTKVQFEISDFNSDGHLNASEFFAFLHPEDSGYEPLLAHLRNEDVRDRDDDRDGRLNFDEFQASLWYALAPVEEGDEGSDMDGQEGSPEEGEGEGEDEAWERREEKREQRQKEKALDKFKSLDADGDGHVNPDELKPVMDDLHPSEESYAKQQALHMVKQADEDSDGKLTLDEMHTNPYVFYSAVYNDEDEDDFYHDEFRRRRAE